MKEQWISIKGEDEEICCMPLKVYSFIQKCMMQEYYMKGFEDGKNDGDCC